MAGSVAGRMAKTSVMSPDETPTSPAFPLLTSVATLAAVLLGGAAVVAAGLWVAGWTGHILPAVGGAGVALAAGVVALLPLARARGKAIHLLPMLAMAGTGLRLVATCAGVLVLLLVLEAGLLTVALWALAWYMVALVIEVRLTTRYMQQATPGKGQTAGGDDELTGVHRADAV